MRKYAVIYRSVLMENLQYVPNIAMSFISYFIFIFIFINLWNYVYSSPDELIAGYSKAQMIWYVMVTEALWFGARSGTMARQAASDIRGGNIACQINRPYHYTLYVLTKFTGAWSVSLPLFAFSSAAMGLIMVGKIPGFRAASFLLTIPVILMGITINAVLKLCISLISFWIEDSTPFQWLYDKLLLVVGTTFPIEIFPGVLQPFFKLTPVYTVCYGPAKLVVDFDMEKLTEILLAQAVYLAAGLGLMFFIYRKGVKKLYVNGG